LGKRSRAANGASKFGRGLLRAPLIGSALTLRRAFDFARAGQLIA